MLYEDTMLCKSVYQCQIVYEDNTKWLTKNCFGVNYTTLRYTTKHMTGPGRKNKTTNGNMNNEV